MVIRFEQGRPKSPIHIIWGVIAIGAMVAGGFFQNHLSALPACVFKEATGIPCLTCGGTRSMVALGNLKIAQAFIFNPLAMLFLIVLVAFSTLVCLGVVFKKRVAVTLTPVETKAIRYFAAAAVIGNWAYLIVYLK